MDSENWQPQPLSDDELVAELRALAGKMKVFIFPALICLAVFLPHL